jgi:hypothetical protein
LRPLYARRDKRFTSPFLEKALGTGLEKILFFRPFLGFFT